MGRSSPARVRCSNPFVRHAGGFPDRFDISSADLAVAARENVLEFQTAFTVAEHVAGSLRLFQKPLCGSQALSVCAHNHEWSPVHGVCEVGVATDQF